MYAYMIVHKDAVLLLSSPEEGQRQHRWSCVEHGRPALETAQPQAETARKAWLFASTWETMSEVKLYSSISLYLQSAEESVSTRSLSTALTGLA